MIVSARKGNNIVPYNSVRSYAIVLHIGVLLAFNAYSIFTRRNRSNMTKQLSWSVVHCKLREWKNGTIRKYEGNKTVHALRDAECQLCARAEGAQISLWQTRVNFTAHANHPITGAVPGRTNPSYTIVLASHKGVSVFRFQTVMMSRIAVINRKLEGNYWSVIICLCILVRFFQLETLDRCFPLKDFPSFPWLTLRW